MAHHLKIVDLLYCEDVCSSGEFEVRLQSLEPTKLKQKVLGRINQQLSTDTAWST
jgi:hypothetical protein